MTEHPLKTDLVNIVRNAHREILAVYATTFDVDHKSDDSPITKADLRAHEVIVAGLAKLDASVPIVSEESTLMPYRDRQTWSQYWLVDPLDGTKEFVKRNGEFTVNIALITDHEAQLGVVGRPTAEMIYFGDVAESRALKITSQNEAVIATRSMRKDHGVSIQSRRRPNPTAERFLANLESDIGRLSRDFRGSSLKFLAIAEGQADIYLQSGRTSEWDTAAAHAVLQAAGGHILSLNGNAMRYNTSDSVVNKPFIAIGDDSAAWRKILVHHLQLFDV